MPGFEPILPRRKKLVDAATLVRKLSGRMKAFVADLQRECMEYEAPPSPRYRRTLTLKRSWSRKVSGVANAIVGEVRSSGQAAPYNVKVKGPKEKQWKLFARRGWRSIDDIWPPLWKGAARGFRGIMRGAKT